MKLFRCDICGLVFENESEMRAELGRENIVVVGEFILSKREYPDLGKGADICPECKKEMELAIKKRSHEYGINTKKKTSEASGQLGD